MADKKMIYIVEEGEKPEGSAWQLFYTFNLNEARNEAKYHLQRLTKWEKPKRYIAIYGYDVEVQAGQTAKAAFDEFENDLPWYPDPTFYEEITE